MHKKNKTVWITGGGSGLGKALARLYVSDGATVVISGRDGSKLDSAAKEINGDSSSEGKVFSLPFDASIDADVDKTIAALRELVGSIDTAILSAGVCEYIDETFLDPALFRRVYDANLFGAVNSANVATSLFDKQSGRSQLVAISSISTMTGLPRAQAYGSSKAAVDYLFDSMAIDLRAEGIDVTVVQPGFITTPMTSSNDFPMPFEMSAEQAARRTKRAIESRKRLYRFPGKLSALIAFATRWKWLWYECIAPKLVRHGRSEAGTS